MIELTRASLETCRADLLVVGVDQRARLDGGAAGAVLAAAGGELLDSLRLALADTSREPGAVVVLPPFALAENGVRQIAAVVTLPVPNLERLREAVSACLHLARTAGYRQVALPALACGAAGLKAEVAGPILLEALRGAGVDILLSLPRESDHKAFARLLGR